MKSTTIKIHEIVHPCGQNVICNFGLTTLSMPASLNGESTFNGCFKMQVMQEVATDQLLGKILNFFGTPK